MINLNDNSFDGGSSVQIFNDGVAGLVRNVRLDRIEAKAAGDQASAPDYKLFFKDSNGAEINMAFWYLDQNRDTFAKDLEKQGKALKHLIHCYLGEEYQFPAFNSPKELLDGCMKIIQPKIAAMVRVYCTYGTTLYPKKYIQVRSYVPFIESELVPVSDTRLKANKIDQMARLEEDTPIMSAGDFTASSDVI